MSYQARWKPHRGYIRLTVGGPMSLLHIQASKMFWNAVCQNRSEGKAKFYFEDVRGFRTHFCWRNE